MTKVINKLFKCDSYITVLNIGMLFHGKLKNRNKASIKRQIMKHVKRFICPNPKLKTLLI